MDFEWDEAKRLSNLAKHGLDFVNAAKLDWARASILPDHRFDYGEDRYRAFLTMDGVLCSIAFTRRAGALRIMSFRRANRMERRLYGS
ncbi:MAG: BrnT family toxin [Rhizomicrobium sp.]